MTIYILHNISRNERYKIMKFMQVIEYEKFFMKDCAENEAGRLAPDLFLFIKKNLFAVKASVLYLSFNIFQYLSTWMYNKIKLHKILDCSDKGMLTFDCLEKGLGLISPQHFVYDLSKTFFFMLHSINWPNFIVALPLLFEILGNISIVIICFPDCDVINVNSEINQDAFLSRRFPI